MTIDVLFAPRVADHLAGVLPDADDADVFIDAIKKDLGKNARRYLALYPHPPDHPPQETLHFRYEAAHATATAVYQFDFVVSCEDLEAGRVEVVYSECDPPMPVN